MIGLPGDPGAVDVCVVASGDWDAFTRVNCHEIAARWTAFGAVGYLEPAPLRAPRRRDLGRIWRRTGSLTRGTGAPAPVGLIVCRPPYVPWHPTRPVRSINTWLAARALPTRDHVWDVLWFFSPALAGLERRVRARLIVYHAVDDYAANPDVRPSLVRDVEQRLLQAADLVLATSGPLASRLRASHSKVRLLENVTDADQIRPLPDTEQPARSAAFVGNLAAHKVDFRLLLDVARSAPDWTFTLVGPSHGTADGMDALLALPNVRHLGPRQRHELDLALQDTSVALLPLPRTDLQVSSFPMKVLDYFALGLPVIGPIPEALEPVRALVIEANTAAEFLGALERGRLAMGDAVYRRRLVEEARRRSWTGRMSELRRLIGDALSEVAAR